MSVSGMTSIGCWGVSRKRRHGPHSLRSTRHWVRGDGHWRNRAYRLSGFLALSQGLWPIPHHP
jgi:hypothetical protein